MPSRWESSGGVVIPYILMSEIGTRPPLHTITTGKEALRAGIVSL
jgi:hypothetical protein